MPRKQTKKKRFSLVILKIVKMMGHYFKPGDEIDPAKVGLNKFTLAHKIKAGVIGYGEVKKSWPATVKKTKIGQKNYIPPEKPQSLSYLDIMDGKTLEEPEEEKPPKPKTKGKKPSTAKPKKEPVKVDGSKKPASELDPAEE